MIERRRPDISLLAGGANSRIWKLVGSYSIFYWANCDRFVVNLGRRGHSGVSDLDISEFVDSVAFDHEI